MSQVIHPNVRLHREFLAQVLKQIASEEGQVIYQNLSSINNTRKARDTLWLKNNFPGLQQSTIDNYFELNLHYEHVQQVYDYPNGCVMISQEEKDQVFKDYETGWDNFRAIYPKSNGIIYLSAPVFSCDKTEAIIYTGQTLDEMIGVGLTRLYRIEEGEWQSISQAVNWMS